VNFGCPVFWQALDEHGKIGNMVEKSYEDLDDLLAKFRLSLAKVRQSDPAIADELKSLVAQLEFWIESLVVDSLKLKSLESAKQKTKASTRRHPKTPGRK